MAYASPSQIRASYAAAQPGVGGEPAMARVYPIHNLPTAPRDAFREKAERQAKQKAEKDARRKGISPAIVAAAPTRPKLVTKAAEVAAARPVERLKPKLTVLVNPKAGSRPSPETAASAAAPLVLASATTAPPSPKRTEVKTPPAAPPEKPPVAKGGGGDGGRKPPSDIEKEKMVDRDLLMGGLLSTALLLFLGWNMFGAKTTVPAAPASPEPLLKIAAAPAPAPDPFPSLAPVELRPQQPLPPTTPSAEPTRQAVAPAAPEMKTAQAPPAKSVPADSACQRVKMVQAYFCTASATLTPDMRNVLEKQLTDWKACLGGDALVVKGYADARGANTFNASLSARRADTLRDFLKSHDVKVSEAKGEGVLPGQTPQDCQNQRRVDVSIEDTAPSAECAPPKDAPLPGCG